LFITFVGWPLKVILPISASRLANVTGKSHWHQLKLFVCLLIYSLIDLFVVLQFELRAYVLAREALYLLSHMCRTEIMISN
jgi:hypothetical protein